MCVHHARAFTSSVFRACEQLKKELESTASRAKTMEGVVAALPAEGDAMRMRAYNWQDVQDLQEVGLV